jgi:dihydrofolate reductase
MAKVIIGMTISVDGYINDRAGSVGPLYADFETMLQSEPLIEAIRDTGAVVMGRNTFAMAEDPDSYAGNYEFQTPIFVVTHAAPVKHPKETDRLKFIFVTNGAESAIRQAKAAAGEKDVYVVGGANLLQQCLNAHLADELHVDLMPILLSSGVRLFENLNGMIQLERIKALELPGGRTHLRFRILKGN